MEPFVYQSQPQRVVFGSGTLTTAGAELERLGHRRAIVLSTPQQAPGAQRLAATLGALCSASFDGATMHTPVAVTEKAMALVRAAQADCIVSFGGGSTTGLGKAIAFRTGLDQLVIPTTYAGSEATPILGETDAGGKTTRRDPSILPEVIVYDVELTLGLPVGLSVASGFNAIAHAVEARYTEHRNPLISVLALEGIRSFASALPRIKADPADHAARSDALYGAWACGTCLGAVGMALHHKLCHVLGGSFDLPHAETHTIVLPHATAYNEMVVPELLSPVADILGAARAAAGLYALAQKLGAPVALKDIGMPHGGLDRAADEAVANPYWNPRPLDRASIRLLLEDAWEGRPPCLG
jgi:maleylacetate reductase